MIYGAGDIVTVKKIGPRRDMRFDGFIVGDHWLVKAHGIPNTVADRTFYKIIHMSGNRTTIIGSDEMDEYFAPYETDIFWQEKHMTVIWRRGHGGCMICINHTTPEQTDIPRAYISSHPRIPVDLPDFYDEVRAVVRLLNSGKYDGVDPIEFCREILDD